MSTTNTQEDQTAKRQTISMQNRRILLAETIRLLVAAKARVSSRAKRGAWWLTQQRSETVLLDHVNDPLTQPQGPDVVVTRKRGLRPIPKRQQRTTQHQHLRKCQQSQSTAEVMPVDGQEAVRPALPHHIHLVLQHLTEANVKYNSTPSCPNQATSSQHACTQFPH